MLAETRTKLQSHVPTTRNRGRSTLKGRVEVQVEEGPLRAASKSEWKIDPEGPG
jgi:hypothetical protein